MRSRGGRPPSAPPGRVSLARALSKQGVCSRTEATRAVLDGRVTVDGHAVHDPGAWVDLGRSALMLDGRAVDEPQGRLTIALHKPAGFVTSHGDPGGRATVYELLAALPTWVFPVGRLDRDSEGLLLLTNDHRLGEQLTDPDHHVPKTYQVLVRGVPDPAGLDVLREGLLLPGETTPTQPAEARLVGVTRDGNAWLEVVLREGRNRQVRRSCAAIGHDVLRLVRTAIGRLALGALAPGSWRKLSAREVSQAATR